MIICFSFDLKIPHKNKKKLYFATAIFFHFIALIIALLHTVTWFGLTPKAMPPLSGRPVPRTVIIAAHYAVWVVLTAGLVLAAAKGGA